MLDLFKKSMLPSGVQMGFYYRYGYFLLPEGYADIAAFMMALKQKGTPMDVDTIVLEEDCQVQKRGSYELGVSMAPYFITDYIDSGVTLTIEDADDVYPVMVELLTQKAYNDRLRNLVRDYCPGCNGFGSVTEKDSSLSGHFSEISLNGVCFYRAEGRASSRVFMHDLMDFGRWWAQCERSSLDAESMLEDLKGELRLKYDGAEIREAGGARTLELSVKKGDIFLSVLTKQLADFIAEYEDENYRIQLSAGKPADLNAIDALLDPEKIASTRKALKKYGVSVGVLTYDRAYDAKIAQFMRDIEVPANGPARLLRAEPGRRTYLITDTAEVLRWLRYCSPMLQSMGSKITVYDGAKTVRYLISFDMTRTVIDAAPESKPQAKKRAAKPLAAEAGRVLNRQQAEHLLKYVSIRLGDEGCNHTMQFTRIWLNENLPEDKIDAAIAEINAMGGHCDCEVLMNCYEDYDLDV